MRGQQIHIFTLTIPYLPILFRIEVNGFQVINDKARNKKIIKQRNMRKKRI